MKLLLFLLGIFIYIEGYSQSDSTIYDSYYNRENPKNWSLSASLGYIGIPVPNTSNNVWGSVNLGYSKRNWNVTLWTGTNFWIEGRQPDLRIGVSTTYTLLKW